MHFTLTAHLDSSKAHFSAQRSYVTSDYCDGQPMSKRPCTIPSQSRLQATLSPTGSLYLPSLLPSSSLTLTIFGPTGTYNLCQLSSLPPPASCPPPTQFKCLRQSWDLLPRTCPQLPCASHFVVPTGQNPNLASAKLYQTHASSQAAPWGQRQTHSPSNQSCFKIHDHEPSGATQ